MEKSLVHAALQNKKVLRTITLIVQAELEDLNVKLVEKETKLKSVEDENVQLVIKLGKLQLYLETADEVQKKFKEEINRLTNELQKSIQNSQEKENTFKTLEKHCSHVIGDYTAECMVLKKIIAEKQAELDISNEKIDSLEQRVVKLEELLENTATDNERLKQEIEEINCRRPEVVCGSDAKETSSTNSVSLHNSSNCSPLPPPPPKQREVSVKLARLSLSPSVKTTAHIESYRKEIAKTDSDKHGDANKQVYKNGFKRHFCKCGLSFIKPHSLNRHISRSRKSNVKNRSHNNTSSRQDDREVHKTAYDFSSCKPGNQTLILNSPKSTHDTSSAVQEHCSVKLNIAGKNGRVHCKCGKHFSAKYVLRRHILQESSGRIFPCTLCKKKFFRHVTLKRHMHDTHKQKSYNGFGCRRCGKVFDSTSEVVIHLIKDH